MMELDATLGSVPSKIWIESGLSRALQAHLSKIAHDGSRLFVVSDETVWLLHGDAFREACQPTHLLTFIVPAGEGSKSWLGLQQLLDQMLEAGANRETTVVAFGGGVIGDLAGFAASILHRGCPFVQVPTTLLSQVDSSVGGKTAINTRQGKNQLGTFHFPRLVLIDTEYLKTLPQQQIRSGYGEILKIALIGKPVFFDWLELNADAVIALTPEPLTEAIATAVQVKLSIVKGDEHERRGQRMLLNLGHTVGHAIEAASQFRVLHGEAIAVGCALAFALSHELGYCPAADVECLIAHLKRVGLPSTLADLSIRGSQLERHFAADKKVHGGAHCFIMVRGIGRAFVDEHLTVEQASTFLATQ